MAQNTTFLSKTLLPACCLLFGLIGLSFTALAQTPAAEPAPATQPESEPASAEIPGAEAKAVTEPAAQYTAQDTAKAMPLLTERALIYNVLVAEVAARRGKLEEALAYYKAAALGSDDYRLAERAASIALFIKDDAALLEIARRWHELTPDQIQASQTLALALLRNDLVDEAVDLLVKQLLDKYDDQQQAYAVLGNLLNQLQDRQLILQVMTRILAHQPESRYALFNHALAALGADQIEVALEDLTNALKVAPDWRDAHLLRAQIRVQSDDIDTGLADLQTAVDAYPEDAELRMGYARLLISAERTDAARQQFELIAQANPDDAEALFALGVLAMESDQYDQAKQYYQRVLELGHRVQDVYFEMGRAEELQENYQSALDWYDRVIQGERYISAQVRAAAMAAKLGDLNEMALRLSELRRENPDNAVQLYISQADILRDEKHYQTAFDLLSSALQEFPDNHDLLYSRALAAERIDKLDVLEDDLRLILATDPDNGHALNALGYTLADRTDRYQEALALLQRAIELLPEDPAVLDSMGWVNYRLGDTDTSLEYLRQAYELNQDPEIVSHLCEVLWEAGLQDEARSIWQKAFDQAPENRHLLRLKDRLQAAPIESD